MVKESSVSFHSSAPLENISAESNDLRGVIDSHNGKFAFKIRMNSFEGFNSPQQREHYNENYIESSKYPEAGFFGVIIEKIDFADKGVNKVRAKGTFSLHGIKKEKIFLASLHTVNADEIELDCNIDLSLEDFGITIPRLVYHKIANIIRIKIHARLIKK